MNKYFKNYQEHKIPHTLGGFDDDGVPLFNPKKIKLDGDSSYHPIVIVQYGLANYNLWIENNKIENRESFLKCAKWLLKNYTYIEDQKIAVYYYDFDLKNPPVKAPWFSGMAQGQVLSLFVRAFSETKDEEYIEVGNKIMNSFKVTIENNGCATYLDDNLFIQEIASSPILYILNGALYAIIGLVEFKEVSKINTVIFNKFIKGLEGLLPKFDLGFWTKYSLGMRFNLSDTYYQTVHAEQLIYLGGKLNNSFISSYGYKFKNQLEKNSKWMKYVHFMSLNMNRALRVMGMSAFLYKKRFQNTKHNNVTNV